MTRITAPVCSAVLARSAVTFRRSPACGLEIAGGTPTPLAVVSQSPSKNSASAGRAYRSHQQIECIVDGMRTQEHRPRLDLDRRIAGNRGEA
jgi:hypothetical protein